jgi:hypothetical protein
MGQAGDERGQRNHELQKRAALHGEREHAMRLSSRATRFSKKASAYW